MESVENRMAKVFEKIFDRDVSITRELTAADVKGWDSMVNIHLMVAMEKEFKVKLSAGEIVRLKNVGQMLDLIREKAKLP